MEGLGQAGLVPSSSFTTFHFSSSDQEHPWEPYSESWLLCHASYQVQVISKAAQGRHLKMTNIFKNIAFQQFIFIKNAHEK